MKKKDILIIGGSASGFVATTTSKLNNPYIFGTHPLLTNTPAAYPLINAAEMAYKKLQ